jgi:AAA ATPase domain
VDHFVGRVSELTILDAELQEVRAGRPRVVLVEGEAGIGKSSLLSRFVSEHRDLCVLRASGDEAEMLLAWGLADQLLAGAGPAATEGSPRAAAARWKDADPMAVGAQLVAVLGDLQDGNRVVAVVGSTAGKQIRVICADPPRSSSSGQPLRIGRDRTERPGATGAGKTHGGGCLYRRLPPKRSSAEVELVGLQPGGEHLPLGGAERQYRPVRVLGVTHSDHVGQISRDLDAVAVSAAPRGFAPRGAGNIDRTHPAHLLS